MQSFNEKPHHQHRHRHRDRFLENNGADFQTHELVELLLFYAIPRKNTNAIAHNLCERFGSIEKMAEASVDELKLIDGVGDKTAILIKLVLALALRYVNEKNNDIKTIDTLEKAVAYGRNRVFGSIREVVYATFTDNSLNVIDTCLVSVGAIDEAKPLVRNIMELCVVKRANAVVLFHNHPCGGTNASEADINFTSLLERELDMIGINFVEHIVLDSTKFNTVLKNIRTVKSIESQVNIKRFYENKKTDDRKEENE